MSLQTTSTFATARLLRRKTCARLSTRGQRVERVSLNYSFSESASIHLNSRSATASLCRSTRLWLKSVEANGGAYRRPKQIITAVTDEGPGLPIKLKLCNLPSSNDKDVHKDAMDFGNNLRSELRLYSDSGRNLQLSS